MAGFLLVTFYTAMVAAALAVELLFQALGLVPEERNAHTSLVASPQLGGGVLCTSSVALFWTFVSR